MQTRWTILADSPRGDGRQWVALLETPTGERVIAKSYGRKRSRWRTAARQLGHWTFAGKSSYAARGRCQTERDVLRLWRSLGFAVPAVLWPRAEDDDPLGTLTLLEYVEAPTLEQCIRGGKEPQIRALTAAFARAVSRRHQNAIESGEPRLLQAHAGLEHVLVAGERFVSFDFEVVSRRRGREVALAAVELGGLLRSLARSRKTGVADRVRLFLEHYSRNDVVRALARDRRRRLGALWRRVRGLPEGPMAEVRSVVERFLEQQPSNRDLSRKRGDRTGYPPPPHSE